MPKTKLNIIKLNIITTVLTLICISCTLVNKIGIKLKSKTNTKENNQNFENKSQDPESLKKKNQKTKASKLETTDKNPENQEYIKIAETDAKGIDFLATFKADVYDELSRYEEMQIKRIIYSS
ncbi:hypothetical protein BGA70 (plasmid) [Borreliella bavariensis PBi]|uniref:Uncharacterized protein n=1 Tax=Borrelia garinii subsp. bavariensis (strain ATCC BAA-2496 / DSM 23469 / PBi) TaxID=290434 RepID=A0A7I6GVC6_BORGP|nr:hypothetical protein BGA70 [Borreliella bavariensis PBi]